MTSDLNQPFYHEKTHQESSSETSQMTGGSSRNVFPISKSDRQLTAQNKGLRTVLLPYLSVISLKHKSWNFSVVVTCLFLFFFFFLLLWLARHNIVLHTDRRFIENDQLTSHKFWYVWSKFYVHVYKQYFQDLHNRVLQEGEQRCFLGLEAYLEYFFFISENNNVLKCHCKAPNDILIWNRRK